ncbi:MAG: hypothetical protein HUU20_00845 [Pirellulales bacterium]|nr:hypothetical protein [Pirellulales bacterium]
MAETNTSTAPASPTAATTPPATGSSLIGKLMIVLFLTAVILAECVVAYLYLPSVEQTAALAGTAAAAEPKKEAASHETEESEGEPTEQLEVDLEEFTVTAFQPASNTTLRIDFHLYGTVATKDQAEFQHEMEKNVHRFREQVIVIVRSAELTDLTDAGLGLIKRKILEKTNRILGKPLLKSVIVSDFSFIEQ